MNPTLRALLIEASPDDERVVVLELEEAGYDVEHRRITTIEGMRSAFNAATWDIVLSEYALPEITALGCLDFLSDAGLDVPVILVSENTDEDKVVETMRAGARDYVVKRRLARLAPAVKRELSGVETRANDIRPEDPPRASRERDLVKRKRVQSQRLESIGALAGGVAHEINNPINAVMNYAQLIEDRVDSGSQLAVFAQEITRECERVAAITSKLLSFARLDKDESYRAVEMADVVNSAATLYRASARCDRVEVQAVIQDGLPKVLCRGQQLQQVILNLLTNARDALAEKFGSQHPDKCINLSVQVVVRNGSQYVRVTVEDRGNGIPEAIRAHLFDPFYTTKPEGRGTGLGLSISHGIVKEHGGEIHVESQQGEWTRIHVDLPVATVSSSSGSAWKTT